MLFRSGVQRSERGGAAVRAIVSLAALTGSFRDAGGGVQLSTSGGFMLNGAALERPDLGPPARTINMSELGKALTEVDDPPVKALVVYNSNPAAIAPNQNRVLRGLSREDLFTVVIEQMQTDTADYADILLPATTFLEHNDLYRSYGHYYLQYAPQLVAPQGEARSNVQIFRALAERMGLPSVCQASDDQMIEDALSSGHEFLQGITRERLQHEHSVRLNLPEPFLPFANGGFLTPSGKFEFHSEPYSPPIESRYGDATLLRQFPLEFLSAKNDDSMNSTFGNLAARDQETGVLHLHPQDAVSRGIASGDSVRAFNQRGEVVFTAEVSSHVQPGVVQAPSVRWARLAANRRTANALTSDRLADIGGGPVFYSCLVEVARCAA